MPKEKPVNQLEALKLFKDWSNYLLVTTVAGLGWASTREASMPDWALDLSVGLLAGSVVFAIFTLAFIPLVAEHIQLEKSFYGVKPESRPLLFFPVSFMTIKYVCWPQHVLFIAGIVVYATGTILGPGMPAPD